MGFHNHFNCDESYGRLKLPQCKEAQSRQWGMLSPASLRSFISFCDCCVETKSGKFDQRESSEVIADNLSKAG
jgi:hypothetical protein